MIFIKKTIWNKGTKGIMKPNSGSFKKGQKGLGRKKGCKSSMGMLGKKETQHHKDLISIALKGKLPKNLEMLHKMPRTEERRNKHRIAQTGEKGSNWRGGISTLVQLIRKCFKYRQWVSDIFTKDNFICQICGIRGGKLEAHHIKSFSLIIHENNIKTIEEALLCEELWNLNNGMTLCKECHGKTDNYGNKKLK